MKAKHSHPHYWAFYASLLLLWFCCGNASAQVLFFDNFEQFTNGADLTSTNYTPVSGPAFASVFTWIDNGSPSIVATNFLNGRWAFFDNAVVTNKDDYRGYLSSVQSNQLLQITWKMWIQATNSGKGGFSLSVPVHDPVNPNIDYNPPLMFMDSGAIVAATNSAPGVLTNGTIIITAPVIGNWASLAGTVITNTLILDYPDGTFSYSLNGQTLATLPLGPYFSNMVDSITFTAIEREPSSLGNRFAIGDVQVATVPSVPKSSFQWAKRIASNGSWPEDEPNIGLAIDTNDNCYVTGWFDGMNDFSGVILTNRSVGGSDMFVAKYNSIGTLQWVQQAGGAFTNYGRAIGVDANGNVYVTGGYQGPAIFGSTNLPATSGEEFFLAKYNSAGAIQWVQPSTGGSDDVYGIGLAVDGAGNSYALVEMDHLSGQGTNVTFGSTTVPIPNNGGSPITVLVKYDNTGSEKWAKPFNSSDQSYLSGVTLDAGGNIYVAGTFKSSISIGPTNFTNAGDEDGFLAKFDSAGGLQWARQMSGPSNCGAEAASVDAVGNVYVAGEFGNAAGDTVSFGTSVTLTNIGGSLPGTGVGDAFLAKYDASSGAVQWARQAGGTNADGYIGVSTDSKGKVYVGGGINGTSILDGFDAVVAGYDSNGVVQWAQSSIGSNGAIVFAGPKVDADGNCYIAGWYQGTGTFGTNVLQPQGTWNFFLARVAPPAPPTLGITLTNGQPQLSVAGDIGSLFSLQRSPYLSATNTPWQTLTTLALTNRPQLYLDTSAPTGTNRFYRAGPPAL